MKNTRHMRQRTYADTPALASARCHHSGRSLFHSLSHFQVQYHSCTWPHPQSSLLLLTSHWRQPVLGMECRNLFLWLGKIHCMFSRCCISSVAVRYPLVRGKYNSVQSSIWYRLDHYPFKTACGYLFNTFVQQWRSRGHNYHGACVSKGGGAVS